jgi:hypothetical protein
MLIKLLLKLWPAITPILLYAFWNVVINKILQKIFTKKSDIEGKLDKKTGEKTVGQKSTSNNIEKLSPFSLKNRYFVITLYVSFTFAIISLIYTAFN